MYGQRRQLKVAIYGECLQLGRSGELHLIQKEKQEDTGCCRRVSVDK